MPHLAGHCDCGRQIHFPNDAALGHEWRCFKCGKVWTLSTQGKPLQNRGSKPPRPSSSRDFGMVAGDCLKSVTGESTDLWSRWEVLGETNRFSKSGSRRGDTKTRASRLCEFD